MPLPKDEAYGTFVDVDGTTTRLDEASCAAVRATLSVLSGGKAPDGSPDPWLTTGQAAAELGVSRRTLTRMLDKGAMPYERYGGGHRRVRLSAVRHFREQEAACRREAYRELSDLCFEGGADDLGPIEEYLAQFE